MTKKDYSLIATAFREVREMQNVDNVMKAGVALAATNLASLLERENPRFDFDKFIEATRPTV